ncbi:MAG: restriction endonuclease subunit S [Betaproteobacteria bacterium]|nr:restriction endonuclease subunit S [Betaproteobacteria bacterium]
MEGLEATEKRLSELERTWRIDAEFFQYRHVYLAEQLAKLQCETATSVANISDGNHFSISESFVEDGIPYYRGQDVVGHFFIEQSTPNTITREAFDQSFMKRSHLQQGDVLLSIVGTVGETSLVKTNQEATCSCKLAILRPQSIAPAYLAVYLSSPIGQSLSERWKRGAVQTGLLLEDMDQMPVARFSITFEKSVADFVDYAYAALETSRNLSQQAEQTLLHTLGLDKWSPPEALSYVRSSREAFAAGRLDADFFQPKYEELINIVRNNKGDYELIQMGELSQPLKYGCSDKLEYVEKGRPFLRIADLENKRFDENTVLRVPYNVEFSISELVSKNDVLISRSGTLGIAVPIGEDLDGAAYGSYFIRSRSDTKRILPEYLSLSINSLFGQMQIEQINTGGVQTNLTIPAIESILIPLGDISWQQCFVDITNDSLAQRERAKFLLEAAKRAVEIAIEDSEAAALAWLEQFRFK